MRIGKKDHTNFWMLKLKGFRDYKCMWSKIFAELLALSSSMQTTGTITQNYNFYKTLILKILHRFDIIHGIVATSCIAKQIELKFNKISRLSCFVTILSCHDSKKLFSSFFNTNKRYPKRRCVFKFLIYLCYKF